MLTRRGFLISLGAAGAAAGIGRGLARAGSSQAAPPAVSAGALLHSSQRQLRAFGTDVSLLLLHADAAAARQALDEACAEVELAGSLLSLFKPASQLCRLNREGSLRQPHPVLVEALRNSAAFSEISGGVFDVTVQPLWELYFAAQQRGVLPPDSDVERARARVDWRGVEIQDDYVRLARRGMAVTLNGIAQGFAADRVLGILRRHGIEHALVNTGELGAIGTKSGQTPWRAGIQHPRRADEVCAVAGMRDVCLSTSGDYAAAFSADYRFNHIFEPATGRSPEHFSSVTVTAPSCADADALSTAVFVAGWEAGRKLLERAAPGAGMLCITKEGAQLATRAFPQLN